MRVLAAQAAADAALDDGGDRIAPQRVRVVLDGERRAAGEADARVIARAGVLVHAVLHADHPFTRSDLFCSDWFEPALALQLAFAVGDDDFETRVVRGH